MVTKINFKLLEIFIINKSQDDNKIYWINNNNKIKEKYNFPFFKFLWIIYLILVVNIIYKYWFCFYLDDIDKISFNFQGWNTTYQSWESWYKPQRGF